MSGIALSSIELWLRDSQLLHEEPVMIGSPLVRHIESAVVDSRLAQPNSLFVALPGEETDGHRFVEHAVQRGAVAALVDSAKLDEVRGTVFGSVLLFPVADPLAAIQAIALQWRRQFPILKRIAITGSNGKTTTKDIVVSILANIADTVYSHGNYNSEIGLPLELLRIRELHEFGVFELGMNKTGEIRALAQLVEPDIAVITNLGSAHVGMLGSRRRIAEEKSEVFSCFTGDQIAIIPTGCPYKEIVTRDIKARVVDYSAETAGVSAVEVSGLGGSVIKTADGDISFPLAGEHMLQNAYAAMTVARVLDVSFDAIRSGLESVLPSFGRGEIIGGEITIIQDCYNANPESMRMAVSLLERTEAAGRRIAILGAMKELGDQSQAAHRSVVQTVVSTDIDEIWLVGTEFAESVEPDSGERVRTFLDDQWDEVVESTKTLASGDVVLLKGSRTVALERLTPIIRHAISSSVGARQ